MKVELNEIRVGNWFKHNDEWSYRQANHDFKEFNFQWNESDWYALGECTLSFNEIEAIPLTEEWLKKFGIWALNEYQAYSGMCFENEYGFWFVAWHTEDNNGEFIRHKVKVQYVHQLQNLYFAIENEELKITNEI